MKIINLLFLTAIVLLISCRTGEKSRIIPVEYENSSKARLLKKDVLTSKLLDPMETMEAWSVEGYASAALTNEQVYDGDYAIRMKTPFNHEYKGDNPGVGNFGESRIVYYMNNADLREFNRLSYWVYPHAKDVGPVHLLTKVYTNDDLWNKRVDGRAMHYTEVTPNKWNQVVWEIEDLKRDSVTGIGLIFLMRGKPFYEGQDTLIFDFDNLELQQVNAEYMEGWEVAPNRIAFSHTGYFPEGSKQAFTSDLTTGEFSIHLKESNQKVFEGQVKDTLTELGTFKVMDFSDLTEPGTYFLKTGNMQTRAFKIDNRLWHPTVEKVMNFFYCERCGMEIPGIHASCHKEFFLEHNGKRIQLNGGWHDAADLTQKPENTEAIYPMLKLARHLEQEGGDKDLIDKLLDEAAWGLDWLMKVRFEDGTRFTGGAMRWYQNGIEGDFDDAVREPRRGREVTFCGLAAAVEASASRLLQDIDEQRSQKSGVLAQKDWEYAVEHLSSNPGLREASIMAWASTEMYALTGEQQYADKAAEMAAFIVNSQQRNWLENTDYQFSGIFTTNTSKDQFFRERHRGTIHRTAIALKRICEELPHHPDWIKWYATLAIHADYYQKTSVQFTFPYNFLPHGIYHENEGKNNPSEYNLITHGSDLGNGWYMRKMVRGRTGGHFAVMLSQSATLASAAAMRNDKEAVDLVQQQLQWIIGRNPFSQSCMIGEGYDFPPYYANMGNLVVGSLPVGIKLRPPFDIPYWPVQTTWAYKEVWLYPGVLWLWNLSELLDAPALYQEEEQDSKPEVVFSSSQKGNQVTLVAELKGSDEHKIDLRGHNLLVEDAESTRTLSADTGKISWILSVKNTNEPWVAVLIVDGDIKQRYEEIGALSE